MRKYTEVHLANVNAEFTKNTIEPFRSARLLQRRKYQMGFPIIAVMSLLKSASAKAEAHDANFANPH